ncbi:hypothetical protein AAHC03_018919 [Spirometra sp. Aus1]
MSEFQEIDYCSICWKPYNDPFILPCQHSFCMSPCLEKVLHAEEVKCPVCQQPFALCDIKPFLHPLLEDLVQQLSDKCAFCALCETMVEDGERDLQSSTRASGLVCADCAAKEAMLQSFDKIEEKKQLPDPEMDTSSIGSPQRGGHPSSFDAVASSIQPVKLSLRATVCSLD